MGQKKHDKLKTNIFILKDRVIRINYIDRYYRKYNKYNKNPLFSNFSKLINGLQNSRTKSIEELSNLLNKLIPMDVVIIPLVSKYSNKSIFENMLKLLSFTMNNNVNTFDINYGIERKIYLDDLKSAYRENIDIDSLFVNNRVIQSVYRQNVILMTDVAIKNINMFLSYEEKIKKYKPKSISFYSLAFYVED